MAGGGGHVHSCTDRTRMQAVSYLHYDGIQYLCNPAICQSELFLQFYLKRQFAISPTLETHVALMKLRRETSLSLAFRLPNMKSFFK